MRKKKEELSLSSKLPGPGIKPKEKPKTFHSELHSETIKGVSILCKVASRLSDDIDEIKSRLDRLELKTHRRK